MAFILTLAFLALAKADPETVEGLMKKDQNTWQVPVLAHQPNENKPAKVAGGFPALAPDTLARPLKADKGRLPFGPFLSAEPGMATTFAESTPTSDSAIPSNILKWLEQRKRLVSTTEKPLEKPVLRSVSTGFGQPKSNLLSTTSRPKLIARPSYNPVLAKAELENLEKIKKGESIADNLKNATADEEYTISPQVAAIIMDDYMARQKDKLSVAGLVIGLTFVAAFLAITVGLVGHGLVKRCRNNLSAGESTTSGRSSRNSWMRSPGHDDRTPPELRPGSNSGHPSFGERSSGRTRHLPGSLAGHGGTPFFNGKLILHDPPGLSNGARGARPFNPGNVLANPTTSTGFMMSSPPSKLGAIPKKIPSPAAQVTDVLVSPKYDEDETTDEEDSDDTVYECPGLASGSGMEVRNPFFMEGGDLHPVTNGLANKKPISQYADLFHHQEIAGLN